MKTIRTMMLTGLAALSMGAVALGAHAQTTDTTTQAQSGQHRQHQRLTPAQRQARMAEWRARREAKLHGDLGITSSQEAAWNSFVASMTPPANARHMDRAAWTGLTAPQRAQKMIELQQQRVTTMQQRLSALNSFYSVLSPQQKQIFDGEAAKMHGHGQHGQWQHRGQTAQG